MHGSAHEKGKGQQSAQIDRQTQVSTQMWAWGRDAGWISSRIQVYDDVSVFTLPPPRHEGLRCLTLIRFRFVSLVWKHGCFSQPFFSRPNINIDFRTLLRAFDDKKQFSALNPDDRRFLTLSSRDNYNL